MNSPADTIVAIATPLGEGAIGVVRVSGPAAVSLVDRLFRPLKKGSLTEALSHTCRVGLLADPAPRDQVVVTLFRAPHSYTGDDVVEISAHGSPFVLQSILDLCTREGARLAGPGEFTQRAFLAGKMDLTQAEAVAELIQAKTGKSQAAAMAQLQGRLSEAVRAARDRLLPLLAHVEVGLDHSDEDHAFLDRRALVGRCREVGSAIDALLGSARIGKILRNGLRVALVGRPNAGKSSLLNALLKEERAIVTPMAGTTRDTLEEAVDWNGIPVVLTDTAGLREQTTDPVERLGMERTRRAADAADFVIGLFDGSAPLGDEDREVVRAAIGKPHVWVMNKSDLAPAWPAEAVSQMNGGAPVLRVSAKTGDGLEALVETVRGAALAERAGAGEAAWLLNRRHVQALERAKEALAQAQRAGDEGAFEECVALELKTALQALGEIIGETSTEDLLGEIFSRFCVGK